MIFIVSICAYLLPNLSSFINLWALAPKKTVHPSPLRIGPAVLLGDGEALVQLLKATAGNADLKGFSVLDVQRHRHGGMHISGSGRVYLDRNASPRDVLASVAAAIFAARVRIDAKRVLMQLDTLKRTFSVFLIFFVILCQHESIATDFTPPTHTPPTRCCHCC